jgi:hypothetical protein
MIRSRNRARNGGSGGSGVAYLAPAARVLHADAVTALAQSHSRVAYINLTGRPITNLEVFYCNWSYNAGTEFSPTSTLTVRAGVEYPSGTKIGGLTTDGSTRDITIAGGALGATLKASGLNIPAGATFFINTKCLAAGGDGNLPRAYTNSATFDGVAIQGWTGAADGSDYTTTGSQPTNAGKAYGPFAISSREVGNKSKSFAIFGDSIARGNIVGKSCFEDGIVAAGYTFINCAFSGAKVGDGANQNPVRRKALALAAGCTDAIINYPVNDLINNTAEATIQSAFTALWTNLKSASGFGKIIQATCTPKTVVDYLTPDPTPVNVFTGGAASRRALLNNWQRTTVTRGTATSFDYLFDMANVTESPADSGQWLDNIIPHTDFLHLSVSGATTTCSALQTALPTYGY